MQKNTGCQDCVKDCKDKSQNAYGYCNRFVKNPTKKLKQDVDKLFGGLFK